MHAPSTEYMFVSLYIRNRQPLLRNDEAKKLFLDKLSETKRQFQLVVAAYAVMDDHAHLLFSAPEGNECSAIVNFLRAAFQRELRSGGHVGEDTQSQVWEHGLKMCQIASREWLRDYLDFIHYDPVRHGLVELAGDYKWSSLSKRVAEGHYPHDWAEVAPPAGVARVLKAIPQIQ